MALWAFDMGMVNIIQISGNALTTKMQSERRIY